MTTRLTRYGFWSYARKDDARSDRRVSQLHDLIQEELELASGKAVFIFQDTSAITKGAVWEAKITTAIEQSSFLIPILTPVFLQRPWCFREVRMFLDREKALRARHPELRQESLIFPIGYRKILDEEALDPEIMAILRGRQWTNIEAMLDSDVRDPQLLGEVRRLVADILTLLRIPIETDAERRDREAEEEAKAAREEERRLRAIEAGQARQDRLAEMEARKRLEQNGAPAKHPGWWRPAALWLKQHALVTTSLLVAGIAGLVAVAWSLFPFTFSVANEARQNNEAAAAEVLAAAIEALDAADASARNGVGAVEAQGLRPGNDMAAPPPAQPASESSTETGAAQLETQELPSPGERGYPQTGAAQLETQAAPRRREGSGAASTGRDIPEGARGGVVPEIVSIQLGAFPTETAAANAWGTLAGRFHYLAPLSHRVVPSAGGSRTVYRLLASGPQAAAICRRLRAAGEECIRSE